MEQGIFTEGRIIFTICFIIAFIIMLIFAYRKDVANIKISYKNWWVVLLFVIAFLVVFIYLKRHFIGV